MKSDNKISLFDDKKECTGCAACFAVCPLHAITMTPDNEGFLYPSIDTNLCINCNKCTSICKNVKNSTLNGNLAFYALKHKNDEVRMESKSGGAFTLISDHILKNKGVIYGCVLDKNKAIHIRTELISERNKMRGSKYVQSSICHIYKSIECDLLKKRMVLFCGTPCQVDGIKQFLKKPYDNLFTIDFLCHGVPSPLVFREYLKWAEHKYRGIVTKVDFCDKKTYGWEKNDKMTLTISSKKKKELLVTHNYYRHLYSQHNIIRPSCFLCKYSSFSRTGDITLGDYWGIDDHHKDFNDNRGCSLLIVNTKKGELLFSSLDLNNVDLLKLRKQEISQPALIHCNDEPDERNSFWRFFSKHTFSDVLKKYTEYNTICRIKIFIKNIFSK